jgi:hypothetical protein
MMCVFFTPPTAETRISCIMSSLLLFFSLCNGVQVSSKCDLYEESGVNFGGISTFYSYKRDAFYDNCIPKLGLDILITRTMNN